MSFMKIISGAYAYTLPRKENDGRSTVPSLRENLCRLKERLKLQKDILGYGQHVEDLSFAIALLQKQVPMRMLDIADSVDDIEVGRCPACDRTIVNKRSDPTMFCKWCGQRVIWEWE